MLVFQVIAGLILLISPHYTIDRSWNNNLYQSHFQVNSNLQKNQELENMACMRATDLVSHKQWSHDNLNRDWSAFSDQSHRYGLLGENLGNGFTTSKGLFNAFMKSPEHHANIIETRYTQIGICKIQNITVVWFWGK